MDKEHFCLCDRYITAADLRWLANWAQRQADGLDNEEVSLADAFEELDDARTVSPFDLPFW